jgi:hypothetical protein
MTFIRKAASAFAKSARKDGLVGELSSSALYATKKGAAFVIPDRLFVRLYHRLHIGRWPQVDSPVTFNEKLQWLKLNYRTSELPTLVDKWEVRSFVESRVGPDVLIPVHGVFESVDDIDFEALPQRFVLKPSHGSGWVIICRDKAQLDLDLSRRKLRRWMRRNYYYHAREWAYRTVKPRIVCEELLLDENGAIPRDFKLFCFGGEPRFIQVDSNRFSGHQRDFYDPDWNLMPMEMLYPSSGEELPRPGSLPEMLRAAASLSQGFPFCRVDFYAVRARIYFGELTFFPENGVGEFRPANYDTVFGDLLTLPTAPPGAGNATAAERE